jgi:hypothetical protein
VFPDSFRQPDSQVAIRVVAAFGEKAIRTALLEGYHLDPGVSFWLSPNDAGWKTAVGLLPQVFESEDHELVVAPSYKVVLNNVAPILWDKRELPEDLVVHRWPCPELRVIRGAAPRPLEQWPEDAEGLLDLAAKAETEIYAAAEAQLDALLAATNRWAQELPERLAQWSRVLDGWRRDVLINDPSEGAHDKLNTLHEALQRLADVAENALFDPSLPAVFTVFRSASSVLVDADAEVHQALEDVRAPARRSYRKRKDIEAREQERHEALVWTSVQGSRRLRMAVQAKVLDTAMGIYRDERLALERPRWMWVTQGDSSMLQKKGVNPSEGALTALIQAQKRDPDAYIGYHDKSGRQVLVSHLMNRPIWTPIEQDWGGEDWLENRTGRVVSVLEVFPPPRPQEVVSEDEEPF